LDHFQNPRCRHCMEDAKTCAHVFNPLCGDEIKVMLSSDGKHVEDISFLGKGCSISQASASMMAEICKGKSLEDIRELYTQATSLIKGSSPGKDYSSLGDIVALGGVRKFPARVKCAVLAWEALGKCLKELESVPADSTSSSKSTLI